MRSVNTATPCVPRRADTAAADARSSAPGWKKASTTILLCAIARDTAAAFATPELRCAGRAAEGALFAAPLRACDAEADLCGLAALGACCCSAAGLALSVRSRALRVAKKVAL